MAAPIARLIPLMLLMAVGLIGAVGARSVDATEDPAKPNFSVGDTPPTSLGISRNGEAIDTRQFAGKVLVVTFWASWCAPCRAEIPVLEKIQQFAKVRLQVVAVNIESRDTFRELHRKLGTMAIKFTNDELKRAHNAYGVNGIPHMLIIGQDGKIVGVHRGYSEKAIPRLAKEIDQALNQQFLPVHVELPPIQ